MSDIFSKSKRSDIMRSVRSSKNKSTELKLVAIFKENGITGWRRGYKIYGQPDFAFVKNKTALFVDGCFWHGHKCRNLEPKDNSDYWTAKIVRNKKRDMETSETLKGKGWRSMRIWECELKNKNRAKLLSKLTSILKR
ncbi:MAG: very short patch repair endonuclease [Endomicrobiia bacterium]|nr:MAG: very short patch repair endonuclease [Endomicrobiia bacterium]